MKNSKIADMLNNVLQRNKVGLEKIDAHITVDHMSRKHKADIVAFMKQHPEDDDTIIHDYFGLRRVFTEPKSVHAKTFSPRTYR